MKTIISYTTKQKEICDDIIKQLREKGYRSNCAWGDTIEVYFFLWFVSLKFKYDIDTNQWEINTDEEKISEKDQKCITDFESIIGNEVVRYI